MIRTTHVGDLGYDPEVGFQEPLLDAFMDYLEEEILDAQMRNKWDDGVLTFKPLNLRILKSVALFKDEETGATATLHALAVRPQPKEATTWGQAITRRKDYERITSKTEAKFLDDGDGGVELVIPVQHKEATKEPLLRVITPSETFYRPKYGDITHAELTEAEAQTRWEAAYSAKSLPPERRMFAVCGTLLPIWDKLPKDFPTVYRMRTDDGHLLIGRIIPRDEISQVTVSFGLDSDPIFS